MPVTTIDPNTALVVVDLQKGVVAIPAAHPVDQVVKNSAALADAFRAHGLPVVLVTVTGGAPGRTEGARLGDIPAEWCELVPELNRQPGDHDVVKRTWGAFTGTDLDEYLKGRGVTQVVVVGVATSAGVESTARHAHELGYHVTLAVDAMTDRSAEAHDNSVTRIFPRLGETGTTEEITALLDGGDGDA
ncbi:isochorismatase family protein [Umezawaea tangerina]|uniref:Nicotinamidase-related amidase n=1 Tax=Umezawaea tangerina TaxID=84725 RepID=A0A2T0SK61_9PSEU|nr:isochorismatase family protein [Umezawaea tangerina]PRY33799.1 nicotinamidase-related amidase [Umezawaea tangerina]